MAKLVKHILIPVFFVFVMSHNAFAVDTIIDISNYDVISNAVTLNVNCKFNTGALDKTNVGVCGGLPSDPSQLPSGGFIVMQRFYSNNSYTFKNGDIIEFDLLVFTDTPGANNSQFSMQNANIINYPFRVLSIKDVNTHAMSDLDKYTNGTYFDTYNLYKVYHYELIYVGPDNGSYQLGWNSGYATLFQYFGTFNFRMVNYIQYRPGAQSQINKEQQEAAEDAAADSQTSGSSSQNDATSATSSLISVITSGIGAITSASASNCVINADMGNFDMGSIDLCANPVPTFMQVIGSIIAALVVLPLVIVLFNRFIAIIGSFQR